MSYLISMAAGVLVGLLYWLLRVKSPAPPLVALIGLLGMVVGEHAVPVVRTLLQRDAPYARSEPPAAQQAPAAHERDAAAD
ncbi:DUF1427 family protein [Burkholderia guangdongensis]|uniref:DUF1427 family protein n=1 Tax=Burkholderia guangdongensis TaxID=1792500 RepID=UPI0015C8CBDB|nr:DUF1427 family protein [Burkholderia guangdongensis]